MKEIRLTQGKVALVDDADFEWLNQWKWSAIKGYSTYYASRIDLTTHKRVSMHRTVLGLTDPKIYGDHKDHNGLNNQRSNLRISTHKQNTANRTSQKKSMEGNRSIAEFMNAKIENRPDPFWPDDISKNRWYVKYEPGNNPISWMTSGMDKQLAELRYYSSWDWLVPAWSKIYVLMENLRDNEAAYNDGADYRDNFGIAMNHNDIETAFEICCEAIKWHRKLTPNQQPVKL